MSHRREPTRRALALGMLAAAGLGLAGCQVTPLYGMLPSGGTVRDDTRAIRIESATTRIGQELRNELIFAFTGGGSAAAQPLYSLRIVLSEHESAVGVEKLADVPAAYFILVRASFVLTDIATGTTVLSGSSFASASYDFSTQRFANLRAKRDAEDRAVKVISDDIRTRIAAHFATAG